VGCITNPETSTKADRTSRDGFYVDAQGRILGTQQNPFPIGAPMGYVIQTVANFGTGIPVKGFGIGTQYAAGYKEYGLNARTKFVWNDSLETVVGAQTVTSQDDSAIEYGVSGQKIVSNGLYADLRSLHGRISTTSLTIRSSGAQASVRSFRGVTTSAAVPVRPTRTRARRSSACMPTAATIRRSRLRRLRLSGLAPASTASSAAAPSTSRWATSTRKSAICSAAQPFAMFVRVSIQRER
jgi:hypothetical protein